MKPPHIYIPSKGRPQCLTARLLLERGYSGDVTIVVGDDDSMLDEYLAEWGDKVLVFDKDAVVGKVDMMDAYCGSMPTGAAPARQAILEAGTSAKQGRFWMMDDDYSDIIIIHRDGSRTSASGQELSYFLRSLSEFADASRFGVIGFSVNFFDNATPFNFDRKVFTNFGMSDSLDVQPWSGRQFEDAVHTISQARVGRPDFRVLNAYVVCDVDYIDTLSGNVGTGGLSELYSIGGDDSKMLNMVRQVGYSIMAHPMGMRLVASDDGTLSKRFGVSKMVPKIIREEWLRHE